MNLRKLFLSVIMAICTLQVSAWPKMTMPKLHVDGRYLCDENGNHVTLHGFGQTYSPWFNEEGKGWGWSYSVEDCMKYNKAKIDGIFKAGWKMNWMRLHMDPYWSNDPNFNGKLNGESDIRAFSMERFEKYFTELFMPMAKYAEGKGMYVVMRPPGVCPEDIKKGDDYYNYLIKVWTYVANQIKDDPYIMCELANEPVRVNSDLTEFFQGVVDAIRDQGCENILWVPGTGWQSNYTAYAAKPIKGKNIGYAVHAYPGWYGSDNEVESVEKTSEVSNTGFAGFRDGWDRQVGCIAKKAPILVTEMDWAPAKYNASWGKANTGTMGSRGFGANLKYLFDRTGNVSWMLFTDPWRLEKYRNNYPNGKTVYTDPEACIRPIYRWYKEYAAEWPADAAEGHDQLKSLELGCEPTISCLRNTVTAISVNAVWADGHKSCVSHLASYKFADNTLASYADGVVNIKSKLGSTDVTISYTDKYGNSKSVKALIEVVKPALGNPFPLTNAEFDPSIWEKGSFDEATGTLITGQYGFGGWKYSEPVDMSDYRYIIIELNKPEISGTDASFRLFDVNNYWDHPTMSPLTGMRTVIDLDAIRTDVTNRKLDRSHIYIAGFWTMGNKELSIKSVTLANDPTGINAVAAPADTKTKGGVYTISGQRVADSAKNLQQLPKGIYVVDGRRVVRF